MTFEYTCPACEAAWQGNDETPLTACPVCGGEPEATPVGTRQRLIPGDAPYRPRASRPPAA